MYVIAVKDKCVSGKAINVISEQILFLHFEPVGCVEKQAALLIPFIHICHKILQCEKNIPLSFCCMQLIIVRDASTELGFSFSIGTLERVLELVVVCQVFFLCYVVYVYL